MKDTGAVYEVRTYGSVRGMRHQPHPTRYVQDERYDAVPWMAMSGAGGYTNLIKFVI